MGFALRAAFIGMSIVAVGVFVFLLLPLVVFFGELLGDPEVFTWEWRATRSGEVALLFVNLTYKGSVPLKDFEFAFIAGGEEYGLKKDWLVSGSVLSGNITLPADSLADLQTLGFRMSFKIAGIYGFSLGVSNEG